MSNFDYIDNVIKNCITAKSIKPVCSFTINKNEYTPERNITEGEFAIYVIREIGGDIDTTFEELKERKELMGKEEKYPKLNSAPQTLYVGLSCSDLAARLRQHALSNAKKTYSLKLASWFSGDYEIDVYIYKGLEATGQLIEDNLAYNLQPAFGKRGGK